MSRLNRGGQTKIWCGEMLGEEWYRLTVLLAVLLGCFGCTRSSPTAPSPGPTSATHTSTGKNIQVHRSSAKASRDPTQDHQVEVLEPVMPTQSEICNSDALLLSVYAFDVLYGSPLPKVCCNEGIKLKEQWRCELDWPSSDVPSCASLTVMAQRLNALTKSQPKWYTPAHKARAIINAGRLRSLANSKDGCIQ